MHVRLAGVGERAEIEELEALGVDLAVLALLPDAQHLPGGAGGARALRDGPREVHVLAQEPPQEEPLLRSGLGVGGEGLVVDDAAVPDGQHALGALRFFEGGGV